MFRQTGAVVAVANSPYDPSIAAAAAIAELAKEELIIFEAFKEGFHADAPTSAAPMRARRMPIPEIQLLSTAGIAAAFTRLHEGLVVLTRSVFNESVATTIASIRRVPVLIIESAVDRS